MEIDSTVGIIIPTFNGAHFIFETLKSVQNQTFQDWQAIIVVDGSSDNTVELFYNSTFSRDRRFHLVKQQNKGVSSARNLAMDMCHSEYIALLDHDDIWHPTKLAEQLEFLEQNPSFNSCVCWYLDSKIEDGRIVNRRLFSFYDIDVLVLDWLTLQGNGPLLPSTLLFRNSKVRTRFSDDFNAIGDLHFMLRLVDTGSVGIVPLPLVLYVQHPTQMHNNSSAIRDYKDFYAGISEHYLTKYELDKDSLNSRVHAHIALIELRSRILSKQNFMDRFRIFRETCFYNKYIIPQAFRIMVKRIVGYHRRWKYRREIRRLWV